MKGIVFIKTSATDPVLKELKKIAEIDELYYGSHDGTNSDFIAIIPGTAGTIRKTVLRKIRYINGVVSTETHYGEAEVLAVE